MERVVRLPLSSKKFVGLFGRRRGGFVCGLLLLTYLVGDGWMSDAKNAYIYVDEKGTSVMTDSYEHVPGKYRDTVKVMNLEERPEEDVVPQNLAGSPTVPATQENMWGFLWSVIPEGGVSRQIVLLVAGCMVGVVAFSVLMMSRNPALQFAMKWLLMFAVVGTVYGLYISEWGLLGGPSSEVGLEEHKPQSATIMENLKRKTKNVERKQLERTDEIDNFLSETDPDRETENP